MIEVSVLTLPRGKESILPIEWRSKELLALLSQRIQLVSECRLRMFLWAPDLTTMGWNPAKAGTSPVSPLSCIS